MHLYNFFSLHSFFYIFFFNLVCPSLICSFWERGGGETERKLKCTPVSFVIWPCSFLTRLECWRKSKPHEALQSLVETTCGQPWVGFAACTPHEDATRCSPLAWRSTDRMFTPSRYRTCKIMWRAFGPRTKNLTTRHTLRFYSHDKIVPTKASCGLDFKN